MYGPNGFYRAFSGSAKDPGIRLEMQYEKNTSGSSTGNLFVVLTNTTPSALSIMIRDESYGTWEKKLFLKAGASEKILMRLKASHQWYDVSIRVEGSNDFLQRFAGHFETGSPSKTDPLMGGVV